MEEYEKQLHIFKEIQMTGLEKTEIRDTLTRFIASHPLPKEPRAHILTLLQHKILSPYANMGVSSTLTKITFSTFALVLILGGSLTYASANSLPGDFLYPVKISIKENIEGTLKSSAEEKLAWQEMRVERRLEEIQTLKNKKGLTEKQVLVAKTVLKEHVDDLKKTITILKDTGKQDVVLATGAKLLPTEKNTESTQEEKSLVMMSATTTEVPLSEEKLLQKETVHQSDKKFVTTKDTSTEDIPETKTETNLKEDLGLEVKKQLQEIQKTVKEASVESVKEETQPQEEIKNEEATKEKVIQKPEIEKIETKSLKNKR